MIKKINAYVVICITTLICFSGCQLTDEENNAPDIRIHINDNYEEESRVACINEEYYYIKDKNLYKHNSDDIIYSFQDENLFIKSYEDKIWVYSDSQIENLVAVDGEGNLLNKYTVPFGAFDFIIDEGIAYFSYDESLRAFELNDNVASEVSIKYNQIYQSADNSVNVFSFHEGKISGFRFGRYGMKDSYFTFTDNQSEYLKNRECFFKLIDCDDSGYTYFSLYNEKPVIVKSSFSGAEDIKFTINELSETTISEKVYFYSDTDINTFVAACRKSKGLSPKPHIASFEEMTNHNGDIIFTFDKKKCSMEEIRKTAAHERILYANRDIALTYYNGMYRRYSIDNWEITSEFPASEIKEGGSYSFEACENYIFVFDNSTGAILNKLTIRE